MKKEDNRDIQFRHLTMDNVRLSNEVARLESHVGFLTEENRMIETETREECKAEIDYWKTQAEAALQREKAANERADRFEQSSKDKDIEISSLKSRIESLEGAQEIAEAAAQANMDYKSIIDLIRHRLFNHNSDASRFLKGELDPDDPYLKEMGFEEVIRQIMKETEDVPVPSRECKENNGGKKDEEPKLPKRREELKEKDDTPKKRNVYTATVLKEMGIDTSNLPENVKWQLIKRKSKEDGLDTWYVYLFTYEGPKTTCTKYKIGRFNVQGSDPMCSKYPESIIKGNPIMPSFARFYLESKFGLHLSENRILEILEGMKTHIPQSSLNEWMHEIMKYLRLNLEELMLEAIRQSFFTQNDETRILVRSRENMNAPFKYKVEYIHAELSNEVKLLVMKYEEGSRDHSIQEENFFKGSNIKYFLCDRAKMYETIEKDLAEFYVERCSCWFHARHYLVDAYISDERMKSLLLLINALFYIEQESVRRKHTAEQRFKFRLKYSRRIVEKIMKKLESIRLAGKEYGALVHRAVNYILDDKEAFQKFLLDGRIEMHNNAIERMFRHIAIGRRNWLHTGSHFAAENIAFMFSLLESCKLNNVNFGEYIEDILTRLMKGEKADSSFLPNNYVPRPKEEANKAA